MPSRVRGRVYGRLVAVDNRPVRGMVTMIIRSPRPASHFTVVSNETIRDSRLSWKARGILLYLLSLPDNWQTSADELVRRGPDGRHGVLTGLQELEAVGYVQRVRVQKPNGHWNTKTLVFDHPQLSEVWGEPKYGFPTSENPTPKEEPIKKNQVGVNCETTYASSEVCSQCGGYGTMVMDGHLVKCEH